tara:strand:- start:274 stop:918 length:645 start_codon:yes stop_codon:yes gene_type:complete
MGFPHGADEDAAFIISWLELNNLNGIKLLVNSIQKIDNRYDGKINVKNNQFTFDLKNSSILMKGPTLVDYLKFKFEKQKKIEITVNNIDNAYYFLPLLYKYSNKIFSKLSCINSKNKEMSYLFINNTMKVGMTSNSINLKKNQVKISISNKKDSFNLDKIKEEKTLDTIQKNLSKSLSPNIEDWKMIEKIANKTFVPESEESRKKGAGGIDDND